MPDIKFVDKHIEVAPPKKPKKITGTRLAAILGLNRWNTPFKAWCEITKTYQEPFEDTKYTIAGKTIEPKQAEYMERAYAMTSLVRPSDIWGEDYFKKTYGDFFPDEPIFGGMWDYLVNGEDGKPEMVLEMKTSQRSEDWEHDIPEYYAIQAALYAFLLGVDDVVMVATFLDAPDYDHPEKFEVNVSNTITVPFKVSERYPDFTGMLKNAVQWWQDYVQTGKSPDWDEKADAEILKALRTNVLNPETDIAALMAEGEQLQAEVDAAAKAVDKQKKRLEAIKNQVKEFLSGQFKEGQNKAEMAGNAYVWALSKSESAKVDEERLKADGLYEKYLKTECSYRMTVSKMKEGK